MWKGGEKTRLDELLKKYEGVDPDDARKLLEQKLEEGQLLTEAMLKRLSSRVSRTAQLLPVIF